MSLFITFSILYIDTFCIASIYMMTPSPHRLLRSALYGREPLGGRREEGGAAGGAGGRRRRPGGEAEQPAERLNTGNLSINEHFGSWFLTTHKQMLVLVNGKLY